MFLHERKDFGELIAAVSSSMAIEPTLVEKDYWIMHCLWGLQRQGLSFELKGGTSLSKGFNIIHRFSEDIDIRIQPPVGMEVNTGKNQNKKAHIDSRAKYYDFMAHYLKIPGVVDVQRDQAFDDQEKMRSGGIRLNYAPITLTLNGLKEGVLLELGFDDTTPNRGVTISSWAFDYASQFINDFKDNRAQNVHCYLPEYTFVEKLQTISTKFRRYKEGRAFPKNFLRHYYDIYCLLQYQPVLDFIKTGRYQIRKIERFSKSDHAVLAENPAFQIRGEDRKLFRAEYQRVSSLYYKGQPDFEVLMDLIDEFLPIL